MDPEKIFRKYDWDIKTQVQNSVIATTNTMEIELERKYYINRIKSDKK